MAYLGRQGVTAPLTSADIPDNSITTAKIVDDNVTAAKIPAGAVSSDVLYLENNTSTQDLSGTYSTERVYFNDSYQLTGNVTVTGHLALGSIADEDIVITQDSTERTITGAGTLEAGNVLQDTHRTSLTDMTGIIGSSNVTFPSGHTIQTKGDAYAQGSQPITVTTSAFSLGNNLEVAITPKSTSNYFKVECFIFGFWNNGQQGRNLITGFAYSTDAFVTDTNLGDRQWISSSAGYLNQNHELGLDITYLLWVPVPTTSAIEIRPRFSGYNNSAVLIGANGNSSKGKHTLIVTEIQG